MRLQRDKYFNTEIENKRLKMQFEIMQKDKNSEINRLSLLLEHKQPPTDDSYARRLEEELRSKEKKNELLIEELQGLRLKMSQYR